MEYSCSADNEASISVGTVNQSVTLIDMRPNTGESPSKSPIIHEQLLPERENKEFNYSLKIAHNLHPGGILEKFVAVTFGGKDNMKEKILNVLEAKGLATDLEHLLIGYMMPGHGLKGKQHQINDDSDVASMYNVYSKVKSPIVIWVKVSHTRKRLAEIHEGNTCANTKKMKTKDEVSCSSLTTKSSYNSHASKMAEVDTIVEELEKKHTGGTYSPEQLRAWAHMIQLKKHTSYDQPPDKPFFRDSKKTEPSQGISPAKRINLRSECIDQLDKWHKLMERGAISSEQYEELQSTIMSDIKKF